MPSPAVRLPTLVAALVLLALPGGACGGASQGAASPQTAAAEQLADSSTAASKQPHGDGAFDSLESLRAKLHEPGAGAKELDRCQGLGRGAR